MPKNKKRSKTNTKRKQKSSSLGIYLIAGIACLFALWLIVIVPNAKHADDDSNSSELVDKKDKRSKKSPKKKPKTGKTNTEHTQEVTTQSGKPQAPVLVDLETGIMNTLYELGIERSMIKRSRKGSVVRLDAPLDKNVYDIYYANMILKGRMEKSGARLLSVTESGSRQNLTFAREGEKYKYEVSLFLDAKPYKDKSSAKTICIVIDDFGAISGDLLDGFFTLPKEVTFAIFPGMKNSVSTMDRAYSQGRETIIHVPMEPIGFPQVDPGKNAILVQMDNAEIDRLLGKFLSEMKYCIGINNHMGSLATTDPDIMQSVMSVLKAKKKIFLDSRTTNVSVAYSVAQKNHLQTFRNDIFLDSPDISEKTMQSKLAQIRTMGESKRNLIAITHCHTKEKLDYIRRFITALQKEGYILVPLSDSGKFQGPAIL